MGPNSDTNVGSLQGRGRESLSILGILLACLRVGATGFGGPMALVGLLEQQLVERRKAISSPEFAEGVAVGQILPGPIAVDAAAYVGYRLHGFLGAMAAAGGLILPPFVVMLILTPLYFHFGRVPEAQGFFAGVRPAVVAVIAAASWRLAKRGLRDATSYGIAALVLGVSLLVGSAPDISTYCPSLQGVAARLRDTSSIVLILLSGGLGLLLVRTRDIQTEDP